LWLLPWRVAGRVPFVAAPSGGAAPVDDVIHAIRSASRYVPAASCLTQAIALRAMLARRGQPAVLNLGVRNPAYGRLDAHAWLEADGRVILGESGPGGYQRLHP
jgi:hypothetical protein